MKVFYSPDYTISDHAFETTRKAGWVAESLVERPIAGVELVPPEPVDVDLLNAVHAPEYVEALRTGEPRDIAEMQGFAWDPKLWSMVRATNGGAVAAAREALASGISGSLSSGLHHAKREHGQGFCTFNGLALAARAARAWTERPVLIIDLDAHCGGGTHELLRDDPQVWHLDVSVNQYDGYRPAAPSRFVLDVIERIEDYLPRVEARLAALEAQDFGLCLYNAGMDPYEKDSSGLSGMTLDALAARERLVFEWCRRRGLPVSFVLAGGYLRPALGHDERSLVELHRLTLEAAARHGR